jgi:clan AA aspartic protease (TIGR02281 family)
MGGAPVRRGPKNVRSLFDQATRVRASATSVAIAGIIVAFVGRAQATTELNCFPARTLIGDNNPSPANRVVKTYVRHSDAGWLVFHTLASSAIIDRSAQYSMSDSSNLSASEQWTGRFNKGPNLIMVGEIKADHRTGLYYYIEAIYDQSRAGALIVKTVAQCSPVGNAIEASVPQLLIPQRAVGAAPVRGSNQAVVPMVSDGGGTFAVPVTINNQLTLKFVVDSGASDVSIPTDVVSTLVRTGTISDADFLGSQTYKLADGSTVPSQRFQIRSLKVGSRTLENVTASIAPIAGQLLLGQSFLRRFESWSIDNGRSALILNGDPRPSDGSQPAEPSLSGLVASPGSE